MAEFDPYLSWLGIPESDRPPTHYALLGLDSQIFEPAVVKTLALQRIAYVRNFQKGEHCGLCAQILEELAHAESVLTDVVKRAAYDKSIAPPPPAPAPVVVKAVAVPMPRSTPVERSTQPAERPRKRRKRRRESPLAVLLWAGGAVLLVAGMLLTYALTRPGANTIAANERTIALPKTPQPPEAAVPTPAPTSTAAMPAPNASSTLTSPTAAPTVRAPTPTAAPAIPKPAPKKTYGPDDEVFVNYIIDPIVAKVEVTRGRAKLTKKNFQYYTLTTHGSDVDDGLEFTVTFTDFGSKTFRVDPRAANRDAYSLAWLPFGSALLGGEPVLNEKGELEARLYVTPPPTMTVVSGAATAVYDRVCLIRATPAAFEEGVEVLLTHVGYHPILLRIDADMFQRVGRRNYPQLQFIPENIPQPGRTTTRKTIRKPK